MTRQMLHSLVFGALVGALMPAAASAQTAAEGEATSGSPQRELRGQLGVSVNNPGLQNTVEMTWTWPLSRSRNPLLSGAHVAAGVVHAITPALTRLGGWVEYSPLSILDLRAGIDPSAYFGTFNTLMSFDAYTDPFDKDARDARGGAKAGVAMRTYVAPTLKMKAGPIVMQSAAELERWTSSATGPLFYEPRLDTLLSTTGGGLVSTTTVAMYQRRVFRFGGTLSAGAIHNLTYVFQAPGNRIQRIGIIGVREFESTRFHLPKPSLTLVVWHFLDDPSRQGQWGGAFAIAFRRAK